MIKVEELTKDLIKEVMPLIKENHNETGQFTELFIDWEAYLSLGSAFVAFIMREEEDITGFLFFMVGVYPHNYKWMMAQQVSFYIKPDSRKYSLKLMNSSEEYLKLAGVDLVIQAARVDTRFCKTLEKRGYTPTDITYCKRLT